MAAPGRDQLRHALTWHPAASSASTARTIGQRSQRCVHDHSWRGRSRSQCAVCRRRRRRLLCRRVQPFARRGARGGKCRAVMATSASIDAGVKLARARMPVVAGCRLVGDVRARSVGGACSTRADVSSETARESCAASADFVGVRVACRHVFTACSLLRAVHVRGLGSRGRGLELSVIDARAVRSAATYRWMDAPPQSVATLVRVQPSASAVLPPTYQPRAMRYALTVAASRCTQQPHALLSARMGWSVMWGDVKRREDSVTVYLG